MKRHLSHSPHQFVARWPRSCAKARLQLRKTWWYWVRRLKTSATQSSLRSRRKLATTKSSPTTSLTASAMSPSAIHDLLHWWLTSRPRQARLGEEAECSLLIATPPRPDEIAAVTVSRVIMAVTGT